MWFLTAREYPTKKRIRLSEYDKIVKATLNDKGFNEKGSVIVEYPGKSVGALANGLRAAIKRLNLEDKIAVSVKITNGEKKVWLIDPRKIRKM